VAGHTPATVGIGALVGGGIGTYLASTHRQLSILEDLGVQVIQIGDTLRVIIPSDRIFKFDSAAIKPEGYEILDCVAYFLSRYGNVPITVIAYTDNVRCPRKNFLLSREQAQCIVTYLWSHGIPYECLRAIGKGETFPVASNGDPIGSFYNRRIVLSLPVVPYHWSFSRKIES